jgi:hypothetical protein
MRLAKWHMQHFDCSGRWDSGDIVNQIVHDIDEHGWREFREIEILNSVLERTPL